MALAIRADVSPAQHKGARLHRRVWLGWVSILLSGMTGWAHGAESPGRVEPLPYSDQRLSSLRAEGHPVLLSFEADWCVICLANDRHIWRQAAIQDALTQRGIIQLKADYTHASAEVSAALKRFGRQGVPLYVYFPEGVERRGRILPHPLTSADVMRVIAEP